MSNTGMLQRCWEHDYCEPCFYMITVVTEPRRDCLGVLTVEADGAAAVALSPLGEMVRDVWRRTSAVHPGIEACECVVMPDHFHGILWVKERLARPMGHMVKAFKRVSADECRSRGLLLQPEVGSRGPLPNPTLAAAAAVGSVPAAAPAAGFSTLWQQGFQDSILLRRGQLKAMANYIADNPRRLAAKRANPGLFTVVADGEIAPGKSCPAIGNRFLLQYPMKHPVQISRRIAPEALVARQEELLIVLLANGFPPLYKPPGRYFDACADGRLLMIAPFPYLRQRKPITREQCLELNSRAQTIVETA